MLRKILYNVILFASNVKHNLENFREGKSIVFTYVFPYLGHFIHYLWLHFHHCPLSLVLGDSSNRAATTASLGSLGRVVSLEGDMDG